MPSLKLSFLGSPQIELDGQTIQIERRKALALLAYLAVTGEAYTRETLATLLWPEHDTAHALAYLRRTLWELNTALGKGWIEVDQERVQLDSKRDLWLDTARFTALLAPHRAAAAAAADLDDLAAAVTLYRDDFLTGFQVQDSAGFEEWQFFQAEKLRGDLAFAVQRLAAGYAAQGASAQALPYAQRWLSLDNLEETAHRQLMRLYAQSGQRAAAIRQYELCTRTLHDELGLTPAPETVTLYEQIRRGELAPFDVTTAPAQDLAQRVEPAAPPVRRVLPTPPTPFVGRHDELAEIEALLTAADCRLLTVMGPGGSGKTRLATASAARLADHQPDLCRDGVYFVPLAPLQTTDALVPAVAAALHFGFYAEGGNPMQQLLNYLREKRMLLVLDNYEHLVDETGLRFPLDVLDAAPDIKLLVTSRTRLSLQGERLYGITGLRTPALAAISQWSDPIHQGGAYSALRLFVQSGQRVQPDFALTMHNLSDVVRICELVDGMPLGIELAAGWLEVLSPAEIRGEIEKSLDFLETSLLDMPARQRSIRAVFDASWAMLTPVERSALQRLAIFRGGFTRTAAEEVAGANLRTLLALANKSWVQRHADDRYHVHELLRQYAQEQLESAPAAAAAARTAHADYYAAFVEAQEKQLASPQQRAAVLSLQQEFENIASAWQWLVDRQQFDVLIDSMLGGVARYTVIYQRSRQSWAMMKRARQALEPLAANPARRQDLAVLLTAEAILGVSGWTTPAPRAIIRQAWAILHDQSPLPARVWTVVLANLVAEYIDFEEGHQALGELLPALRAGEDRWLLAFALRIFANQVMLGAADHAAADQLLREALAIQQHIEDDLEQAAILADLANLGMESRAYDEAADLWRAARDTFARVGDIASVAFMTWRLGDVSIEHGEFDRAFALFHEAQHTFRQTGNRGLEIDCVHNESVLALRYSTSEHARRTRQYCLEVNHQLGLSLSVAWSTWELGEIERFDGHPDLARDCYEAARRGFLAHDIPFGMAYYHRGMGELALAAGDFDQAQTHFRQSVEILRAAHHRWTLAYVLSAAGRSAISAGDMASAQHMLTEALDTATHLGQHGLMMAPLAAIAAWHQAAGHAVAALRLAAFVAHHWATWHETRQQAAATREQAAAALPSAVATEVRLRGEDLALPEVLAVFGAGDFGFWILDWGLGEDRCAG